MTLIYSKKKYIIIIYGNIIIVQMILILNFIIELNKLKKIISLWIWQMKFIQ